MVWAAGNEGEDLDGRVTKVPSGILPVEQGLPVYLQASISWLKQCCLQRCCEVQLHRHTLCHAHGSTKTDYYGNTNFVWSVMFYYVKRHSNVALGLPCIVLLYHLCIVFWADVLCTCLQLNVANTDQRDNLNTKVENGELVFGSNFGATEVDLAAPGDSN